MEYKMGLQEKYFNAMRYGNKKFELRLCDEKRKELKLKDTIWFMLEPDRKKKLKTRIVGLYICDKFSDFVDNVEIKYLSSGDSSNSEYLDDLEKYYSKEEQEKYGILAIEVEVLEKSCGMIIFKKEDNELKVLLVRHNIGHWGFPKGHVEENETEEETAVREVYEETGIKAKVVGDFRKVITYKPRENAVKDVVFFIGEPENNNIVPQLDEVCEVGFVEVNEAFNLIGHDEEKELLEEFIEYYQNNFYN